MSLFSVERASAIVLPISMMTASQLPSACAFSTSFQKDEHQVSVSRRNGVPLLTRCHRTRLK
jgi:hypothetical protein